MALPEQALNIASSCRKKRWVKV